MKIAFTDALIRGLKAPVSGRTELADSSCRGLCLRVTTTGVKTFAFRYRDRASQRVERVTVGPYPDVSLRDARAKADRLRQQVAAGKNPSAYKRQALTRSFAALAERYLAEHARRHKRSAGKDERNLRLHILPHWRNRDFHTITRADVIALVERLVGAGTPTLANRVQALISTIFNFAIDADLAPANPAMRLRKRGVERVKTRTLTDDEIRLFWRQISEPPVQPIIALALKLVLAVGVRPGEASGMARSELEFVDGRPVSWTIPAARSKSNRAHFVPLAPLASDLIVEALAAGNDPVFTLRRGGYLDGSALATALTRMARAFPEGEPGAASWKSDPPTPHDLRRTTATRLSAAGVPAEDVSAILGHVRGDVTGRVYDQHRRAPEKTRALERWSRLLSAIVAGTTAANVVAIR
jgi:integrase